MESRFVVSSRLVTVIGISVVLVTTGFWLGRARTSHPRSLELGVPLRNLDFGDVWAQKSYQWPLPITNNSGRDVTIVEFKATCGCLGVTPSSVLLPAGATREVRLDMDLTGRRQPLEGAFRPFAMRLMAIAEDGSRTSWAVKGRVRFPFDVLPSTIVFDGADRVVRGTVGPTKRLRVECLGDVRSVEIECDPKLGSAIAAPRQDEPGIVDVLFTPSPNLGNGQIEGEVFLIPVVDSGEKPPRVPISVWGAVGPDVHVVPDMLHFPPGRIGQQQEQLVVVQSASGLPFRVQDCRVTDSWLEVPQDGSGSSAADSHTFRILARVEKQGHDAAEVRFAITRGDDQCEPVFLPVTVYGLSQ